VLCFRVLSGTSLVSRAHRSSYKPRRFNSLQPLELSSLSFCNSHRLFSVACSLFSQNTGGGYTPRTLCPRGSADHPPNSMPPSLRCNLDFARPLFSYSYELLFPQALYFDNHLNCPGVWGLHLPSRLRALCVSAVSQVLPFSFCAIACYRPQAQGGFFNVSE